MISFRFKADHILNQKYGAQETPLLHRRNIITGPDLCIVQNLFFLLVLFLPPGMSFPFPSFALSPPEAFPPERTPRPGGFSALPARKPVKK